MSMVSTVAASTGLTVAPSRSSPSSSAAASPGAHRTRPSRGSRPPGRCRGQTGSATQAMAPARAAAAARRVAHRSNGARMEGAVAIRGSQRVRRRPFPPPPAGGASAAPGGRCTRCRPRRRRPGGSPVPRGRGRAREEAVRALPGSARPRRRQRDYRFKRVAWARSGAGALAGSATMPRERAAQRQYVGWICILSPPAFPFAFPSLYWGGSWTRQCGPPGRRAGHGPTRPPPTAAPGRLPSAPAAMRRGRMPPQGRPRG